MKEMQHQSQNLIGTTCAICGTDRHDKILYLPNFNPDDLSFETFSARRLPDRVHYQIVRCRQCGLVRSNPILDEKTLNRLYQGSHFTYANESLFAAETYALYLKKAFAYAEPGGRLLEIGCGNGSFLRKIKPLGFKELCGIEPSQEAVDNAGELKPWIKTGMFGPGIYPSNHFDMICAFQVFDHISRPNEFLSQCREILRPGGIALFINHDIGSPAAKLLGRKCPMIDIEHTILYDKKTIRKIFVKNGFEALDVFDVANRYPLSYWLKLAPLPKTLKGGLLNSIQNSSFEKIPVTFSLGNMGIIARAPKGKSDG